MSKYKKSKRIIVEALKRGKHFVDETAYLLSTQANATQLMESIAQDKAGETTPINLPLPASGKKRRR